MKRARWVALAGAGLVAVGCAGWASMRATLDARSLCPADSALRARLPLRSFSAVQFARHEQDLCAAERAQGVDAVRALGDFGALGARALALLVARDATLEKEACETLAGMGKAGISGLVANARRETARAALARVGVPAVRPLLDALEQGRIWRRDGDEEAELWVGDVLRRIDDPRATQGLLEAIDTGAGAATRIAVDQWERVGPAFVARAIDLEKRSPGPILASFVLDEAGPLAVSTVIAALDAKKPETNLAAFRLLEKLPKPVVAEALLRKIGEGGPGMDGSIACWLRGGCVPLDVGRIGTPSPRYDLPLPTPSERTRAALQALLADELAGSAAQALLVDLRDPAALARPAQGDAADPEAFARALAALAPMLTGSTDEVLRNDRLGSATLHIQTLVDTGGRRAVPHLLRLLRRFERVPSAQQYHLWPIERTVFEALEKLGDPQAVPYLLERVRQSADRPLYQMQHPALGALGSIGDRRAVPLLIELSSKSRAAQLALAKIGDPRALPALLAYPDSCPTEARIWVLGQLTSR